MNQERRLVIQALIAVLLISCQATEEEVPFLVFPAVLA